MSTLDVAQWQTLSTLAGYRSDKGKKAEITLLRISIYVQVYRKRNTPRNIAEESMMLWPTF
jgi:hypothetical protein